MFKNVKNHVFAQTGIIHWGITDSVISKWISKSSILLEVIKALLKYFGVYIASSHQHVGSQPASIEKGRQDLLKLSNYFTEREPFPNLPYLIALDTSLIGNSVVNYLLAYSIGLEIVASFNDLNIFRITFKTVK